MNGKQHRQIGLACGAGYTIVKYFIEKQDNPEIGFPWSDLLLNAGIGYVFASLPDWIEPATSPHHRQFFHSMAAAAGVGYGAFGKHSNAWPEEVKKPVQATALAYLYHIAVDSTTARSISLIHPRLI